VLSIDEDSLKEIQPELRVGETVLWAGRPDTSRIFHRNEDESLFWFSLLWGGFATFFEGVVIWSLVSTPSNRTLPWFWLALYIGLFFAVTGQYLIWGRFVHGARKKKRTYYAVTNRRVIAVQNCRGRKVASKEIDLLPVLVRQTRSSETGTLRFAPPLDPWRRDWSGMFSLERRIQRQELWDPVPIRQGPVLVDIEDVDSVYQLISSLRTSKSEAAVADLLRSRGADQHGP
jgi:hypothetical protein